MPNEDFCLGLLDADDPDEAATMAARLAADAMAARALAQKGAS